MPLNWDQSDRVDPAYAPMSPREERAQEAYEDAAGARLEFRALAEKHAKEALELAKKFDVEPEGGWVEWAQRHKQKFAEHFAEVLWDAFTDQFHLPDPDDVYEEAMEE